MAQTGRIRVAKDKAELVKALTSADGATGPFQTYADVIVFAPSSTPMLTVFLIDLSSHYRNGGQKAIHVTRSK